jgi:hypothetical protein
LEEGSGWVGSTLFFFIGEFENKKFGNEAIAEVF